MLNSKSFLKMILSLLIPLVIQNIINVGVVSTDVIMLSKYNEISLAAVSLASQIQFILTLIYFGISSGAMVLTAQYWGKKEIKPIEKVMGIAIKFSFYISLIFFIFAFFFSYYAMRIFTNDDAIINEGIKYLKVVSFSYLVSSLSVVYLYIMRSIEKVTISTIVYSISLITNFIVNYLLIFGKFGFPKMGVYGAAIGTVIAKTLELILVFYYDYKNKNAVSIKKKYVFSSDPILKKDFFKYSTPVILNELMWSSGMAANMAILGRLGSSVVAANSITGVVRQLSMILCFGMAATTAIVVGREIGAKNYKDAQIYASKFLKFSFFFGLLGSITIFLLNPSIVKYFAETAEVENYLKFMLNIMSYYIICQGVTVTLIVGIFRAGGDTKMALLLDVGAMWGGSIIIASIAAFYFKLPPKIVYLLIMSDEFIKTPLTLYRYKTKKWLNNVTREKVS